MKAYKSRAKARPLQTMKSGKPNAELVWKQLEDDVVPRLRLSTTERVVYSHLIRHTRLEGKRRLHFSMAWLARGTRLCDGAARPAVRRLVQLGALLLIQRNRTGHIVDVRLPHEIPAARLDPAKARRNSWQTQGVNVEALDFLKTRPLRQAIHEREGGHCFYCLRRITPSMKCLDHVVPSVHSGLCSYRNLVSCCWECNSQKGDRPATDFLRWLYRQGRITTPELTDRLRALHDLAEGKLRPTLPAAS
ncbi:MAG TPA: HNH endonuclease signature motif containing protein [Candidatus Angelobacter sp.]|nr:HNH endonuclease signature motif containing protein [Candidatus Angelobacter sp.]